MKRVIIYHDDADGRCAATIAGSDAQRDACNVECHPMHYHYPVPWGIFESFRRDVDELWIVDFSFPPDVMAKLFDEAGLYVTWIDHHKTAIDGMGKRFAHVAGVRNVEKAACLLTWEHCFPKQEPPLAVQFIADRDIWAFSLGDATKHFYESFMTMETHPGSPAWDGWLSTEASVNSSVAQMLLEGEKLYKARMKFLETMAESLGRPDELEHDPYGATILAVNFPGSGDMGQIIGDMGYDMAHCYVDQEQDGKMVRVHSLYTDDSEIDVGAIAKAYGGGGHKGAAGWTEVLA